MRLFPLEMKNYGFIPGLKKKRSGLIEGTPHSDYRWKEINLKEQQNT